MKRFALLSVIIAGLLLTGACGASTPPPSPTTSAPIPTATAPATETATVTALQTTTSTPQVSTSVNGTEVNVTLGDNTIKSSQTTFKVGVPYAFIVLNTGRHAHDFNIAPPVSVAGILDAALSSALLSITRDKLQACESVTVEYTFPNSAVDQKLEFSCLIPRHYQDGMLLAITVTK